MVTEPPDGIDEAVSGAFRVGGQAAAFGVEEVARIRRERAQREAAQSLDEGRTAGRRADALEAVDRAAPEALRAPDRAAEVAAALRDPDAPTQVLPAAREDRASLSDVEVRARAELVARYGEQWHTRSDLPEQVQAVPVTRLREWHEQHTPTEVSPVGERERDRRDVQANAYLLRDRPEPPGRAQLPSIEQMIPRDPAARAAQLQARGVTDRAAVAAASLASVGQARPASQVPIEEVGRSSAPVPRVSRRVPEREPRRHR